jgi:hypothetical protein
VLGARLGEQEATLRAASRVLGVTASSNLILGVVLETTAAALASSAPEHTATLQGAVDAIMPGFAEIVGLRAATDSAIDAHLDRQELSRRRDEGSRMSEDEATAFTQALIDDVLAGFDAVRVSAAS